MNKAGQQDGPLSFLNIFPATTSIFKANDTLFLLLRNFL